MPCYARNGDEITFDQYVQLLADGDYQRLDATQVGPYWVSTLWLGIDHGFGKTSQPVIFETMVFALREDPDLPTLGPDVECRRWCTEDEARQGHAELVTLVRATLDVEVETEGR